MHQPRGLTPRSSRIVATHAALAGMCPLIPLPFVDDLAIRNITRRMVTALYAAHGLTPPRSAAKLLSAMPANRLHAAFGAVARFAVKKVLHKIVYVLAVKDCADVASTVFHDGWLLAHVLEDPEASPANPAYLRRVRKAMLQTYEEIDPAPLRRALVGSFTGAKVGLRHGIHALQRLLRDRKNRDSAAAPAPPDELEDLTTRVGETAVRESQYMDALERIFRRHLGLPDQVRDEPARHGA